MTRFIACCISLTLIIGLFSFQSSETQFEFSYPKRENTGIRLKASDFKKFKKEWRGQDYYYYAESKSGIICSVLYFKLSQHEVFSLVDEPKKEHGWADISPAYPFEYFSNFSNLKEYEKNNVEWGRPSDDFMFRQNDVIEYEGVKINQKNMYGYGMVDKDLFVNVHLSKTGWTEPDSVTMRQILNTLSRQ